MNQIRIKPPFVDKVIYIKQNKQNAATPKKWIAAFLRSTRFYVFALFTTSINGIYHIRSPPFQSGF